MKYLCIIPARCGSKGIKHKNIVEVCGTPLIHYTIAPAMKADAKGLFEKTIVSTDCEEIADVARKLGANVPFIRPEELAKDTSKSIDFVYHALDYYKTKDIHFDAVVILQPTSPLRTYEDIENAIRLFNEGDNDSLISVYKDEGISDLNMYYKEDGKAIALNKNHNQGTRRQDHKTVYIRNGAFFITKVNYIRSEEKLISDVPLMYEMNKNKSINIDTREDLESARYLLSKHDLCHQ